MIRLLQSVLISSQCDSVRPTCGPCARKARTCQYEYSHEGVSRQQAMKARLDSLEALFKQLKEADTSKAQRLFDRLRSSDEIQSLVQEIEEDAGDGQECELPNSATSAVLTGESMTGDIAPASHDEDCRSSADAPPNEPRIQAVALRSDEITDTSLTWGLNFDIPSPEITEAAVERFFACAGTLLHVYSRDDARELHKHVFSDVARTADWRASLCCLCAIASIGKSYDHSPDSSGISRRYYDIVKSLFEDLIEVRSLDGIKVCTLLALYNIFDKATLALIHIGESQSSIARTKNTKPQFRSRHVLSKVLWPRAKPKECRNARRHVDRLSQILAYFGLLQKLAVFHAWLHGR